MVNRMFDTSASSPIEDRVENCLREFDQLGMAREAAVMLEDLAIENPVDGWSGGLTNLLEWVREALMDEEGNMRECWIPIVRELGTRSLVKHEVGEVTRVLIRLCAVQIFFQVAAENHGGEAG
jgi:hypothetical protein